MKCFLLSSLIALGVLASGCASNQPVHESVSRAQTDTPMEATKVEKESGRTLTTEETIRQVHSTNVVVD